MNHFRVRMCACRKATMILRSPTNKHTGPAAILNFIQVSPQHFCSRVIISQTNPLRATKAATVQSLNVSRPLRIYGASRCAFNLVVLSRDGQSNDDNTRPTQETIKNKTKMQGWPENHLLHFFVNCIRN